MATTVIEAFNKFLADQVNLCDDETKIARASRDQVLHFRLGHTAHRHRPALWHPMNWQCQLTFG